MFLSDKVKTSCIVSPAIAEYEDLMFLTPKDLKKIMRIGDSLLYEFLKDAPFRVEKIGGKLYIPAPSFWEWYFKDQDDAA